MANRFAYYYNEYCTKTGMSMERFVDEFRGINELFKKNKIEIDHANNDLDNNCTWNLSAIDSSKNNHGGKGTLLAEIKPPYFCFIAVMEDASYRVEFGYIAPQREKPVFHAQSLFIHCRTIDELINFLHRVFSDFVPMGDLPKYLERYGTPQFLRSTYKTNKIYFAKDFGTTERMARRLMEMDAEKFIEWNSSLKWGVLLP